MDYSIFKYNVEKMHLYIVVIKILRTNIKIIKMVFAGGSVLFVTLWKLDANISCFP